MFALGRGVFTEFLRKDEYSVLILGLDNAGKSTYADTFKASFDKTFVRRHPSRIMSTVGLNHLKIDCGSIILNLSDVGGHKDLRSLWLNYIDEAHVLIFVMDGTDEERLNEALEALNDLLRIERVKQIPLLVLINKCEQRHESTLKQSNGCQESTSHGNNEIEENNSRFGDASFGESSTNHSFNSGTDHAKNSPRSVFTLSTTEERAELIRVRVFECLDANAVATNSAIISISASENLNVHKSALWILNAILEQSHDSS